MTSINDQPPADQASALKKAAALAKAKSTLYWTETRLMRLAAAAIAAAGAGLGLGAYHVSVPFIGTTLLGWLGQEFLAMLTGIVSGAHLSIRKAVILPIATYDTSASVNSLLASMMRVPQESPDQEHGGMFL